MSFFKFTILQILFHYYKNINNYLQILYIFDIIIKISDRIQLIHIREYVNSKEPMYKIGRSYNMYMLLLHYLKDSYFFYNFK